jgi:hypothetical protein
MVTFLAALANILLILVTAALYGKIEAVVYDAGFQPPDNKELFGWFSPSYHIPAVLLWLSICILAGEPKLFFTYCFIEDLSYFSFSAKDDLDDQDWVNWKLGGFYLSNLFPSLFRVVAGVPRAEVGYVPFTYVALNAITILLYVL